MSTPPAPAHTPSTSLPVAVIGAGPVGLAAAAHLLSRGQTPLVLEAGDAVGASMRAWAHVQLFSPWKYLVDPLTRDLLETAGWTAPEGDALPTGGDVVRRLLEPLAALPTLAPHIRLGARVVAVSRRGYDKVKSAGREAAPFELVVRSAEGQGERILARAVIDASGTYEHANPIGASGLPVEGERALADRVHYGIPDVLGRERARYAGRRTLVVGSGHSAFNALLDLARLAQEAPGTEVVWAIRRAEPGLMFGGGALDALPARGQLGERLRTLVDTGAVRLVTGFAATRLVERDGGVVVEGEGAEAGQGSGPGRRGGTVREIGPVDEVVVTTGFRPDLELTRELRLALDPWLEAPVQLAPLIDPNEHSCGTVYPHGAAELAHPEADYYVVGMKSYGRAPTFLLLTGYEQVRSVVCALVGDVAGARDVRLVLPETGVCSSDRGEAADAACCGSASPAAAPLVTLGALPRSGRGGGLPGAAVGALPLAVARAVGCGAPAALAAVATAPDNAPEAGESCCGGAGDRASAAAPAAGPACCT